MKIKQASFITSAADKKGFLNTEKPVIAVSGKSNVGKSSFINMLAGQKKLARTSASPGRTRLVNYFDFGEFILADLPGYGYAEVSKAEKAKWAKTLDDFFVLTKICRLFALVDIRHEPTADDKTMIKFLYHSMIPFTLVATKADKIAKTKVKAQAKAVAAFLSLGAGDIIATSSQTGLGKDEVFKEIENAVELFYAEKEAANDLAADEAETGALGEFSEDNSEENQ